MNDKQICGECRYHQFQVQDKRKNIRADGGTSQVQTGWLCVNNESDYYTDWTDYSDTCDCFEQRGI